MARLEHFRALKPSKLEALRAQNTSILEFAISYLRQKKCRKGGIMQAQYATPATDCNADRSCQKKV